MLHTIYRMSLGEIISTSGTFVFTSFLSQAKNRSEFIDDEFILQPRKELYWPVAQHLLTLCNCAWARMCVCMCVCESVSVRYFLVPKASRLPPSTNHAMNDRVAIVASNEFDECRCIGCTCMLGRFISRISVEEERERAPLFRCNPKRREPPRREKWSSNSR